MRLNWKEFAYLWWPVIAYAVLLAIGAIYVAGYNEGKRLILKAAIDSARESGGTMNVTINE